MAIQGGDLETPFFLTSFEQSSLPTASSSSRPRCSYPPCPTGDGWAVRLEGTHSTRRYSLAAIFINKKGLPFLFLSSVVSKREVYYPEWSSSVEPIPAWKARSLWVLSPNYVRPDDFSPYVNLIGTNGTWQQILAIYLLASKPYMYSRSTTGTSASHG